MSNSSIHEALKSHQTNHPVWCVFVSKLVRYFSIWMYLNKNYLQKYSKNAQGFLIEQSQCPLYPAGRGILLMEEIPHHLGSIKPCKWWDRLPINWCRISSIHSFTLILWQKYPIWHMMIFICSKEGANKKYQNLPIRFLLNKNGDYFISHKIHVIGIFTY